LPCHRNPHDVIEQVKSFQCVEQTSNVMVRVLDEPGVYLHSDAEAPAWGRRACRSTPGSPCGAPWAPRPSGSRRASSGDRTSARGARPIPCRRLPLVFVGPLRRDV